MQHVRITDLDVIPNRPSTVAVNLTEALGTSDVGVRYYELEPGELIGRTYHKHDDQEELFYVTAGTVTFQVGDRDGPTDELDVSAGEVVRFAPGDYQRGTNQRDERAAVLGIGAPKGMNLNHVVRLRECKSCEAWTPQAIETVDGVGESTCEECGAVTGRFD